MPIHGDGQMNKAEYAAAISEEIKLNRMQAAEKIEDYLLTVIEAVRAAVDDPSALKPYAGKFGTIMITQCTNEVRELLSNR